MAATMLLRVTLVPCLVLLLVDFACAATPPPADTAIVELDVPDETTVVVNGHDMKMARRFKLPSLKPDRQYACNIAFSVPDRPLILRTFFVRGGEIMRVHIKMFSDRMARVTTMPDSSFQRFPLKRLLRLASYEGWVEDYDVRLEDYDVRAESWARDMIIKLGERAVAPLVAALDGRNSADRRLIVSILAEIGRPAEDALIAALKHDDIRTNAVRGLRQIGTSRAVGPLIRVFRMRVNRYELKQTLKAIGEPAVQPLITALKDADPEMRRQAARTLGMMGDRRAVEPLIAILEDDRIRGAAADALGCLGDKRAVEPLIAIIGSEDRVAFRSDCVRALGAIGDKRALVPLISMVKGQRDDLTRGIAAAALGNFHDDDAIDALIGALRDDNGHVRESATASLGKIGDKRAIPPLVSMLADDGVRSKKQAAASLMELGDERGVEILLSSADEEELATLVERGIDVVPPCLAALENDDANRRRTAAWILGRFGDERAVVPLIKLLNDNHEHVQHNAARALGSLTDKRAVEPLVEALRKADGSFRVSCVEALGRLGDAGAFDALQSIWLREAGEERLDVMLAWAMYRLDADRAMTLYLGRFRDADMCVRAVKATGTVADHRAIDPLLAALKDYHANDDAAGELRDEIIKALGNIGDHRAIAPLLPCLRRYSSEATFALWKLGWRPADDVYWIHWCKALGWKRELLDEWKIAKPELLTDLRSRDAVKRRAAVATFIWLGNEDALPDLLSHLAQGGDKDLALIYLNSGNMTLQDAAKEWGRRRGYSVELRRGDGREGPRWGKTGL
jgi:HEAT repeat protein